MTFLLTTSVWSFLDRMAGIYCSQEEQHPSLQSGSSVLGRNFTKNWKINKMVQFINVRTWLCLHINSHWTIKFLFSSELQLLVQDSNIFPCVMILTRERETDRQWKRERALCYGVDKKKKKRPKTDQLFYTTTFWTLWHEWSSKWDWCSKWCRWWGVGSHSCRDPTHHPPQCNVPRW